MGHRCRNTQERTDQAVHLGDGIRGNAPQPEGSNSRVHTEVVPTDDLGDCHQYLAHPQSAHGFGVLCNRPKQGESETVAVWQYEGQLQGGTESV